MKKSWGTPPAPLVVEFLGFSPVRVELSCARASGAFMRTEQLLLIKLNYIGLSEAHKNSCVDLFKQTKVKENQKYF